MKLNGSVVQFFLAQEFDDVEGVHIMRAPLYDFPMLYDEMADMSGHVVLVPEHVRPQGDSNAEGVLFVCMSEESVLAASESDSAIIWVRGDVTLQQLYNYMQTVFVRNERLDAQLQAYVDTYAGFQPLLDACAQGLGFSCALVDEQYRGIYQAHSGGPSDDDGTSVVDMLESEAIDLFMASHRYRYMRASHNVFAIPGSSDLFMKNVFFENELVGTLVMRHAGSSLAARFVHFFLDYLNGFVEEMFARLGSFGQPSLDQGRIRDALQSLLDGEVAGPAALAAALVDSGHDLDTHYVVLRIERSFTHESESGFDYLSRRLEESLPDAYCFTFEGHLFMLVDIGPAEVEQRRAFLSNLPLVARENLAKVGVSRVFKGIPQLKVALKQAGIALEQGSVSDPTYWYYRFDDYALSWIFSHALADVSPEHICHPAVTTLREYDRTHGAALLDTLAAFMNCRYNATEAAQELFIARSTLLSRLSRIVELTQIDLSNTRDRLYLALSLEMFAG